MSIKWFAINWSSVTCSQIMKNDRSLIQIDSDRLEENCRFSAKPSLLFLG